MLALRHKFAELSTRNECAACFLYPIALESEFYFSPSAFHCDETARADRVTSIESRRDRSHGPVRCFEETPRRFDPLSMNGHPRPSGASTTESGRTERSRASGWRLNALPYAARRCGELNHLA